MIRQLLLGLSLMAGLAAPAGAACTGTDIRSTLSAEDREKVARVVDRTPYAEGNHWIARKGDRVIHLIGTMHLSDPRLDPIFARLAPLIDDAGRVFFEQGTETQQEQQKVILNAPDLVFLTDGPTIPELLTEKEWQDLRHIVAAQGVPPFLAAKMQPWLLGLMAGIPPCALDTPGEVPRGLDVQLMERARAAGVPISGLEEFSTLVDLFGADPIEEQVRMLRLGLAYADEMADYYITLTAQYFEEKLAEAWALSFVDTGDRLGLNAEELAELIALYEDRLLVRRNAAWLPRILAAGEKRIVVAVGALHLMNDYGLPALLEREGYRLERAPF